MFIISNLNVFCTHLNEHLLFVKFGNYIEI